MIAESPEASRGVSLGIAGSASHHRVLVVDDSTTVVRILAHLLKEEGYDVASAADGEQGLERIRDLRPSVVIVDTVMPKRDGYEVCRAVRTDAELEPKPYLLMLTSGGQEADRELALQAGADEFMTKPFSPSKLTAQVAALLGDAPAPDAP